LSKGQPVSNGMKPNFTLYKNISWALVTLLIISITFSLLFVPMKKPVELTISQLVERINKGEVEKIIVRGNDLSIDLKNKDTAIAKKENIPLDDHLPRQVIEFLLKEAEWQETS